MLWKKKAVTLKPPQPKVEKLPGPKPIPGLVEKHLIAEYKMEPDLVRLLKAVVRRSPKAEKAFDFQRQKRRLTAEFSMSQRQRQVRYELRTIPRLMGTRN